jgi:hypothetical protein
VRGHISGPPQLKSREEVHGCPRSLLLALLIACLATGGPGPLGLPPARAEHAVAYRYTVLGYVTDASGRARTGTRVELSRQKTGFSYLGETDAQGFYLIVARLGDESVGEALALRVNTQGLVLVARFDPQDHATERGTRVDFSGPRTRESPALFADTLKRFLSQ